MCSAMLLQCMRFLQRSRMVVVEPQGTRHLDPWITIWTPVFPSEQGYPPWIILEPRNTCLYIKSLRFWYLSLNKYRHTNTFDLSLCSVYPWASHLAFQSLHNLLCQWGNEIGILGPILQMKELNEVTFAKILCRCFYKCKMVLLLLYLAPIGS